MFNSSKTYIWNLLASSFHVCYQELGQDFLWPQKTLRCTPGAYPDTKIPIVYFSMLLFTHLPMSATQTSIGDEVPSQ